MSEFPTYNDSAETHQHSRERASELVRALRQESGLRLESLRKLLGALFDFLLELPGERVVRGDERCKGRQTFDDILGGIRLSRHACGRVARKQDDSTLLAL